MAIQFLNNPKVGDNTKIEIGDSSDLKIYHDPNIGSVIEESGAGDLFIDTSQAIKFRKAGSSELMALMTPDDSVDLYYDNAKKFETTSTGVQIGTLTSGATAQLVVNHEGGSTAIASFKARTNRAQVLIADNDTTGYLVAEGSVFSIGRTGSLSANNINIDSSNNVGIGTTSPSYKLTVNDSTANGRGIQVVQSATSGTNYGIQGGAYGSGATKNIGLSITAEGATTNDAAHFMGGNVGIGTTSPDAPLTVHSSSDPEIRFGYSSTQDHRLRWDSSKLFLDADPEDSNGNSALGLSVDGLDALYIDALLNVGIGTTAPSERLHVNSGTENVVARFESTDTAATIELKDTTGTVSIESRNDFRFSNSSGEKMRIDSTGDVGIGETSVDARLHITTASAGLVNQKFESAGSAAWRLGIPASQTYFAFDNANDNLSAPKLVINNSGFVGIGTTAPSNKFVVAEGTNQHGIELVPGTLSYIQAYDRATSDYGDLKIDAQTIAFGTDNGAERMRIDSAGRVGIGTTAPSARLHIQGTDNTTSRITITNTSGTDNEWSVYANYNTQDLIFLADSTEVFRLGDGPSATFAGEVTFDNVISAVRGSFVSTLTNATVLSAEGNYTSANSVKLFEAKRTGGAVAGNWSYDDATTDMSLGTSTAHSFSLKTGNTRALTIDSSQNATFTGKVGMNVAPASTRTLLVKGQGTTSSTAAFQVNDGNNADVFVLKDDKSATFEGQVNITSSGAAHFSITNTNVSGSSQQYLQYVGSNGDYVFRNATDSTTPLFLAKNNNATFAGNIGLSTNTTTPSDGNAYVYKSSAGAVLSGYQAILETGSAGSRATALTLDNSQNATFAGDVTIGSSGAGSDKTLNILTGGTKSSVKLMEAGTVYGFSTLYDGATNKFHINRHSNSAAGTAVISLNRDDDNATFAGNVNIGATTGTSVPLLVKSTGDNTDVITVEHTGNAVDLVNLGQYNNHGGLLIKNNSGTNKVFFNSAGDNSYILDSKLGIGTTSPLAKLHLSDTTGGTIYIEDSDATTSYNVTSISNSGNNLTLDTRSSTGTFVSTDYQIAKNTSGADFHRWFTQGSEKMRLTSTGLGIGTTAPAKKLEISSGTSGDGILLTGTGSFANGASRNIEFSYSDTDTSYASAIKFEVKDASVHGGQIGFFTDAGPSSSGSLGASIRAMTIDPSQNVGIGTASPTGFRLVVENTSEDLLKLHNSTDGLDALISFTNPGGTLGRIQGLDNGGLGFDTGNNAGGINTNAMLIDSAGNVGIGVTPNSPANGLIQLDVGDTGCGMTSRQNNELVLQANANYGTYAQAGKPATRLNLTNTGEFHFLNAPAGAAIGDTIAFTEMMRITSSGDVGIGTNNPASKLQVDFASYANSNAVANFINGNNPVRVAYDTVVIAQTDVASLSIVETPDGVQANEQKLTFAVGDNASIIRTANTSSGLYINVNAPTNVAAYLTGQGTTAMRFLNNGNVIVPTTKVGIGTTSPVAKLDVVGSSSGAAIRVAGLNTDSTAHYYGIMHDATDLQGTTQVNTFFSGGTIKANTTIAEYAGIRIDTPGLADGSVVTNNYGVYQSSSLQKNYFAGNVGIGTTSPGNKLHIQDGSSGFTGTFDARNKSIIEANGEAYLATYVPDNSYSGLRFFNSTTLKGFIDYYHGTQGNALVYSATGYHKFMTSGTEKVRIINNGNVGIGVTAPAYKLEVSGGAIAIKGNAPGSSLRFDSLVSGTATSRNALYVDTSNVFQIGNTNYASNNIVGPTKTANLHVDGTLRVDALSGNAPSTDGYQEPSETIIGGAGSASGMLGDPGAWLDINVDGDNYYIPLYSAG